MFYNMIQRQFDADMLSNEENLIAFQREAIAEYIQKRSISLDDMNIDNHSQHFRKSDLFKSNVEKNQILS